MVRDVRGNVDKKCFSPTVPCLSRSKFRTSQEGLKVLLSCKVTVNRNVYKTGKPGNPMRYVCVGVDVGYGTRLIITGVSSYWPLEDFLVG